MNDCNMNSRAEAAKYEFMSMERPLDVPSDHHSSESFKGFCLRPTTDTEAENLMNLQAMIVTAGSLFAGLVGTLFTSIESDGIDKLRKKWLDRGEKFPTLDWAPQYACGVALTCAVLAVMTAVMLYVELAAANIPRDIAGDGQLKYWLQYYYFLLVSEVMLLFLCIFATWVGAYYVGMVHYQIVSNYLPWTVFGLVGITVFLVMFAYISVVHVYRIVPHSMVHDTERQAKETPAPVGGDASARRGE